MYNLEQFPELVAGGKPLDGLSALGTAGTGGASSIGRLLVEAVEKTNHTPAGLKHFAFDLPHFSLPQPSAEREKRYMIPQIKRKTL